MQKNFLMSKKIKGIIYLLIGFFLGVLFLETIYSVLYQSISQQANPHPNPLYLQIYAFLEPNNLIIIMSILFFVGIMLVALFEEY